MQGWDPCGSFDRPRDGGHLARLEVAPKLGEGRLHVACKFSWVDIVRVALDKAVPFVEEENLRHGELAGRERHRGGPNPVLEGDG